ncbi:MAG: MBG domain-containing protein [Isosphaeraceae bacterium]
MGTILHAGDNRELSVTFTPSDTADYATSSASVLINVARAALTIAANSQSITYGGPLPGLTVSYIGLVNGDTAATVAAVGNSAPTVSTVSSNSQVGSYAITASGASDPDYTIRYKTGTLTIEPAPLTITANNQSTLSGQPIPSRTVSCTGLVNGDTPTSLTTPPCLSTTATSASPVGTYPILVGGAADPNYTITYQPGVLTVSPALVALQGASIRFRASVRASTRRHR